LSWDKQNRPGYESENLPWSGGVDECGKPVRVELKDPWRFREAEPKELSLQTTLHPTIINILSRLTVFLSLSYEA
jgi:hypothetical protein